MNKYIDSKNLFIYYIGSLSHSLFCLGDRSGEKEKFVFNYNIQEERFTWHYYKYIHLRACNNYLQEE